MNKQKTIVHYPSRHLTVSRKPGSSKVASLMLAGQWLEDAGFQIGNIVHLEVTDNQIIIRKTNNRWLEEEKVIRTRMMVNEYGTRLDD